MALAPGVLAVTVEFARDLKDRDWIARQDPYCVVRVGGQTFRTRTATDGGRNPVWDQTFEFNLEFENDLEIDVMDDEFLRDEPLGTATCNLAQVRMAGSERLELPVVSTKSGRQHGFVAVSLRWAGAGYQSYGGYGGGYVGGYGVQPAVAGVVQVQEEVYPHHHHHHHHRRPEVVEEVVVVEPPPVYYEPPLAPVEVIEVREEVYPHHHHHHRRPEVFEEVVVVEERRW